MNLYKIRDWDRLFETAETKKLKSLRWVPTPNKHDGKSYRRISMMKCSCEIFTAWMLILQIASKCHPRGTLIDGEKPITTEDMAIMTGFSESIFQKALPILSNGHIDWIECISFGSNIESAGTPAESAGIAGSSPAEGREGMEGKEEIAVSASPQQPTSALDVKLPSRTIKMADEEFLVKLRGLYPHLDVQTEINKMTAWLLTPKARGRRMTRQFVVGWLNRIDTPIVQTKQPKTYESTADLREIEKQRYLKGEIS